MKQFRLTDAHLLNRRLEAEDFTAYAGYPVFVFELSDFPHWHLLKENAPMSYGQEIEREKAIGDAALLLDPKSEYLRSGKVQSISWKNGPSVLVLETRRVKINSERVPHYSNMGLLTTSLLDQPSYYEPLKIRGLWQKARSLLSKQKSIPHVIAPTTVEIPREDISFEQKTVVAMLEVKEPNEREFWAKEIGVPIDRITFFPNEGLHVLRFQLHEMHHLKQVGVVEPMAIREHAFRQEGLFTYHNELGADAYTIKAFEEASVGDETIRAIINSRYLQMFTNTNRYWFAPALEKIASNQQPPNATQIYDAVTEMHCRLAMQDKGLSQDEFSSQQIQNAIASWENRATSKDCGGMTASHIESLLMHYNQNIADTFQAASKRLDPNALETTLSNLRNLYENGVFTESLSSQISGRILEAGEYFSSGISYQYKHRPAQTGQQFAETLIVK